MNNEICPICGEKYVMRCKCPLGCMVCNSGHEWHTCILHNVIVMGKADHSLATNKCRCKIGDTGTDIRYEVPKVNNNFLGQGI